MAVAFLILAALAATVAGAPEPGQAASAADVTSSPSDPNCELHVWPGRGFRTTYFGWGHGGTVDGALMARKGYSPLTEEMLSTARQIAQLEKLQLAELVGLKGYRQIVHRAPLDSRTIRVAPERHSEAPPACYAELMIDTVVFQHNVLNGKGINTVARFRRFDGDTQVQSYGGFAVQPVLLPVSGDDVADPAKITTAFEEAFAKGVTAFGADVRGNATRRQTK
jgi:hypothetical protein